MSGMPIREAMKSDIITVSRRETMDKVARLMTQWNVTFVVVLDGNKPVGVITEKDVLGELVARDRKPSEVRVEEIMSSPVISISADETVSDALDKMMEYDVRRLPVVDGGDLVGLISRSDISDAKEKAFRAYETTAQEGEEEEYPYGPAVCEICGQHSTHLRVVNGRYVCDDCANIAEMDFL